MDGRGYSARVIKANREASTDNPGVRLGRFCIARDVPVQDVASYFGVSRVSIYAWFTGKASPRIKHVQLIDKLLDKIAI